MNKYIFVNPGHGNEPFILGCLIANQLKKTIKENDNIVAIIPEIYKDRQKRIISELNLNIDVIFDTKLGKLYEKILLNHSNFNELIKNLNINQEEIQSKIKTHLKQNYENMFMEINTGSKIVTEFPSYYIFPALFSDILKNTIENDELTKIFHKNELTKCYNNTLAFEKNFNLNFIPQFHTFSYDKNHKFPFNNIVFTPPPKPYPITVDNSNIPENSIYFMISGTLTESQIPIKDIENYKSEGYNVILPPWIELEGYMKRTPEVISNKNITKVIGRAGFGTIWICQQTNKEFIALPYQKGDDPEVYFNEKTIDSKTLEDVNKLERDQFGKKLDGIKYISDKILENYFSKT